MAKVNFTALIESITGKLAGSVFQDSYQGFQIRSRVSPRNPRTQFQQLRRGEFGFLTQTWRMLTPTERATWTDNAPAGMSAINFYVQSNINLILVLVPAVASFSPGTATPDFPLAIEDLGGGIFTVYASGSLTVVPAGKKLLLQATYEKLPTKIFTNPSQYSPIQSFPSGTDFSAAVDISSFWVARYGQFTSGKRICIKTNLIDSTSGNRGDDSIFCATQEPISSNRIIDYDGTYIVDSDGTFLSF